MRRVPNGIREVARLGMASAEKAREGDIAMVVNGTRLGARPRGIVGQDTKRRKTRKMLEIEAKIGEQLEHALPELVTEHGLSNTAVYLGLSKATLGYWLLKLDIVVKRVALAPGDELEVRRGGKR